MSHADQLRKQLRATIATQDTVALLRSYELLNSASATQHTAEERIVRREILLELAKRERASAAQAATPALADTLRRSLATTWATKTPLERSCHNVIIDELTERHPQAADAAERWAATASNQEAENYGWELIFLTHLTNDLAPTPAN